MNAQDFDNADLLRAASGTTAYTPPQWDPKSLAEAIAHQTSQHAMADAVQRLTKAARRVLVARAFWVKYPIIESETMSLEYTAALDDLDAVVKDVENWGQR